jgi:serine/threonine-protein kinase
MPLTAGTRLGSYEILARLGAGGMGEVYRARDVRLDRQVAIKVLPDALVGDADRLARFDREAKVLASLNHPLIAQVYGVEETGRTRAIVMELVEGLTLDERLAEGPVAVADALNIARQIAEALEAAHDLGVIHRDLKPANIKLLVRGARPSGTDGGRHERRPAPADVEGCTVKVLDFGLAKALGGAGGAPPGAGPDAGSSDTPTITSPAMTELGVILGTAAYMSPEQARGRIVDKRADVWSFGVVLYEMLVGTRPFKGEDVSDTLAAVLRQPLDLSALPEATPTSVRALVERCLERDARQRLRDIGEARIALERTLAAPDGSERAAPAAAAPARVGTLLPWLLFATTAVALSAVLLPERPAAPDGPAVVTRLSAGLGIPGTLAVDAGGPAAVLSPDGRTIVMRVRRDATTRLYVRRLDQLTPVELAGTEHATHQFFSPDGTHIGFFASGGLKTMPLAGGAVVTLTDATTGRGAAWDANGDILFQSSLVLDTPLVRINASGERTDRGTTLAPGDVTHRWPQILPGGRVLYSAHTNVSNWDDGTLRIETAPGAAGKVVLRGGYHGRYVPTGHLLYVHAGTLYGVRFDLDRLEPTSSPVAVIEHLASTHISGSAQYSFASNGMLVYVPGSTASADARLHWVTARGETSALKTTPGAWGNPRFSPDGTRLALQIVYGSHDQIAIYDLATDRLTQLTLDAANHRVPVWTTDGRYIVYSSDAGGNGSENLYWRRADGEGNAGRLTTGRGRQIPAGMHPNGRSILYAETVGPGSALWLLPLQGSPEKEWTAGTPSRLGDGKAFDGLGAFSPDGRLVAYMSDAAGPFAIYVRPVEGGGGPWRVSTSGGAHPAWSRTTRELLFTTEDQIMTAPYRYDGRTFTAETPRPWSPVRYTTAGPTRKFDLHPNGTRVILAGPDPAGATAYNTMVFVINFFGELERLLPAAAR